MTRTTLTILALAGACAGATLLSLGEGHAGRLTRGPRSAPRVETPSGAPDRSLVQPTDRELDAIALRHRWPVDARDMDKLRATMTLRGIVQRAAATETLAAVMSANSVPGADGIVALGPVTWQATVVLGREPDLTAVRRAALRRVADAALERVRRLRR